MPSSKLIFSSDATRIGQDPRLLAKRAQRGELIRVRRGAYVPAGIWAALNERQRHGVLAAALVHTTLKSPVFTMKTAGLLWGLGVVGVPRQLQTLTDDPRGGRSKNGVHRTLGSLDQGVCQLGGFQVTDKARTTIELAGKLNFGEALAVVDSSRRDLSVRTGQYPWSGLTAPSPADAADWDKESPWGPALQLEALEEAVSNIATTSRQRRASKIIEFSAADSESPGESISRANMILQGFPAPRLQATFTLKNGKTARTDFWWPELDLVGEFDGQGKYLRSELRGGKTIQQVVMDEKARENALRALGLTVIRWDWGEMMNPRAFANILTDGGLRSSRTP
ncbi:MAG: type IV toxin-antitoxin system AbiEi family antitoxin domain-containing protein [Paenarthrobacter ureafaciens]|nr:type IV toxin-antitoxin system AbiEi family antitoxin domain-containing protein [Paenarthrobacter ureafaciens]